MAERGRLIVLYGVNNIGKSTQLTMLASALAAVGERVVQRKSPHYESPSGRVINAILREGRKSTRLEQQLWFAVNMNREQDWINGQTGDGVTVLMEDYWGTTMAWGLGHGITRQDLDAMLHDLRIPDVAIMLHGRRFGKSREAGHLHEQNDDLTERVQQHHLDLADEFGWPKVAANQTPEEVHHQIIGIVNAAAVVQS